MNHINKNIEVFCEKQGIEFDFWCGEVGSIASFHKGLNPIYFSYQDVFYDINSNQPKGKIIEWYFISLENHLAKNYFEYCKNE